LQVECRLEPERDVEEIDRLGVEIRDERRVGTHLVERHVERVGHDGLDAHLDVGGRRAHDANPVVAVRENVSNANTADSPDGPTQPDATRAPGDVFNSSASSIGGAAASATPSACEKSTGTSRWPKTPPMASAAARPCRSVHGRVTPQTVTSSADHPAVDNAS